MPRSRSIHIGVDVVDREQYGINTPPTLAGCQNDAHAMMELATAAGFDAMCLLNDQATADHVLSTLRKHAELLQDGDRLVLTYAGHGSTWADESSDEEDGQDETWVLYDRQLFDDELRVALARFRPGVRVLFISDSCHSGTVNRGGAALDDPTAPRSRSMSRAQGRDDRELRRDLYDAALAASDEEAERFPEQRAALVLIAACQDDELANEEPSGHGRLTAAIVDTWEAGAFEGDLKGFFRAVRATVREQTPRLDSSGVGVKAFLADRPFGS